PTDKGDSPNEQSHKAKEANFEHSVATIQPKVENKPQKVTKEHANLLHSREAGACGVTRKDDISAQVMGLAEKNVSNDNCSCTQQQSGNGVSAEEQSHKGKETNFEQAVLTVHTKMENEPENVTKEDANLLHSRGTRAHGHTKKGGIAAQAMSLAAKNQNKG
ncbi:hypothetical protein K469DRAFT_514065, partial [Zopfia rhizophila CBS 207.26]